MVNDDGLGKFDNKIDKSKNTYSLFFQIIVGIVIILAFFAGIIGGATLFAFAISFLNIEMTRPLEKNIILYVLAIICSGATGFIFANITIVVLKKLSEKMKKITVIILLILFIVVLVIGKALLSPNIANVTVVNQSNQTISILAVSLYHYPNKIHRIEQLTSGKKTEFQFNGFSDTHFILKGKLADGTKIDKEIGYLTHGINFNDKIIILEKGEIELKVDYMESEK